MTDLTNVPVRNINDLELAENIPLDASVLDAVKIPVGGLTQFTQGEALSLKQLREVLVAAMPGWVPSTIDDLIARSDAEVQKMLEKYLNAIKDVSVVLDAIQGQINESHLALELNKKIDIGTLANGAAARAQETANAAYAAAGAAADAARAEGQAAVEHANQRVEEAKQLIEQAEDSAQEAKDAAQNALNYAEAEVLKAKNLAQQAVDQANGVLAVTQEGITEAKNLAQQAVDQANDVLDVTIEEINAAKQEAQQLTEQARQAAQALVTALDEKFTALNVNINTEISNLNAGLTQETTARQEGLAQITTTLNAYKAVVDDNLAVLFSKNETIVSDAAALATQVNALKSQVALVEGKLPLKLDASVIQNYYTKAQSEANATSVAAGEITKYDSQLVIGGVNLFSLAELKSYAGGTLSDSVPYVTVTGSTLDVTNQGTGSRIPGNLIPVDYTKDIIISWYPLGNYTTHQIYYATQDASGAVVTGQRSKTATKGADGRIVITIPKSELSPTVTHLRLGLGSTSNTTYSFKDVQVEQGSKVTAWAPSPRDTQASLNANATAIQNTDTEVSRVNGVVVSQGQSLTTLQNNLNITNGEVAKKADATVVDGVTSRVAATESGLTSVGNRTTALENSVNHATTGLATKASTSALSTTNSNVSAIDGVVKGHTNQLTQLSSDVVTINNGLATKLDSSVINNYYTKAQTDAKAESVAAGKIEEFNAGLSIDSVNIAANSYRQERFHVRESTGILVADNSGSNVWHMMPIRPSSDYYVNTDIGQIKTCRLAWYDADGVFISGQSVWQEVNLAGFVRRSPVNAAFLSVSFNYTNTGTKQLLVANSSKPVAYSVATTDTAAKIDANSTAIQNTNAEVTRVDGRVTAANSAQTLLEGRVSNVEGAVATKAEAAALTALTTRVGTEEGKSLSQGNAITALQNTINHATTGLATKASTAALTSTNSEVSRVDGVVKGHTNQLTQLSSDIVTLNNGLATKLDSSVISNYYTKAQTDAKAESVAAGKVEEFSANLKIGGDNLFSLSGIKRYTGGSLYDTSLFTVNGREIKCSNKGSSDRIGNAITLVDTTQPLLLRFTEVEGGTDNTLYYRCNASDGAVIQAQRTVTGTRVGKVVNIAVPATSIPEGTATINIGFGGSSAAITVTNVMVVNANVMPEWTSSSRDVQAALDTNSTAIQNTNAEVTRVDGVATAANNATTALAGRVSNVEGAVATKAEAAALTSLTTRVSNAEGVNTSQGSAITALENSVNHATTGLTSKASSSALTAVDNKVTAANGRIDTTNSNVTTLTGRVSTVEGAVSTKAEAAALTALTTRVGNAEGVNTSQGTAITTLQNTVNHATTGLATKASTSALTATNSEVSRVNGVVTGHTNQLTQLTADITTINGNLATKADATALNDIYTKTQADAKATEIAAGEVSKYDASLVIGGTNLVPNSNTIDQNNNGSAATVVMDRTGPHYKFRNTSNNGKISTYTMTFIATEVGKTYTLSLKVRPDLDTELQLYGSGTATANPVYGPKFCKAGEWTTLTLTFKSTVTSLRLPGLLVSSGLTNNVVVEYKEYQLEEGTKATAWSPAIVDVQSQLDTNATAIENTNAEVRRVDGRVTTESNRTTTLTGRVSTVEGDLAKKADASALSSLTTRVESEEGKSTSQGSAITALQNTVNHATTGLATKASSSALTAVDNKVTAANGRIDTTNSNVTTLSGRVATVEGDISKKADASALTSLTTRVEAEEGKSTSQSAAITALENSVNHTTTGLSTKASSAALTAVDNRVTVVDGRVNTTNSNVATLTGRVSTVEGAVSTKAEAAAVTALTTRVGNVEGGLETASSNITSLTNSLDASISAIRLVPTQVSIDAAVKTRTDGVIELMDDASTTVPKVIKVKAGSSYSMFAGPHVQINPNTLYKVSYKVKRLSGTGTFYLAVMPLTQDKANGVNNANSVISVNSISSTTYPFSGSTSAAPVDVWKEGVYYIKGVNPAGASGSGTLASPRIMPNLAAFLRLGAIVPANTEFALEYFTVEAADADALDAANTAATSAAISATNSEVSRVNGVVVSQGSQLLQLSSSIQTINGTLNTKLDSSVISNYYTKAQSDTAADTIATGKIDVFKSSLSASAMDNLVIDGNTAKTKTGGYLVAEYALSKTLVAGKTYTIRAKVSFNNGGNTAANLRFYLGGNTAFHPAGGITAAVEDIVEVSAVAVSAGNNKVGFYCFPNNTANANAVTTVHWVEVFEGSNLTLNEKASASALTATNSEVGRINGVVAGQASQLTTIQASVGDVLDTINIKDTRSTNQPPTWYRANYARRRVSEFKTQTVIGVGGFFPGTYCNLETLVHYGDSSGGPILQTATATNDPSLYVQRYSTGSGTSEVWGAWIQPIKDLRDSISGKADASVVNAITVKVDGMSSHASQLSTLTSELDKAKNQLAIEAQVINGIQANYMVKMETNGVLAGFGLIQESGAMGAVTSNFGVNADNFFIGAPASNKKPFMVTTKSTVVNGVTYPAGTWIDTAMIANATIGGAKITAASIDTAQITDGAITNAKILDATIESAKIKSIQADKIEVGNPLVGPITPSMVTGTSLTNAGNLFNGNVAANAPFATYGAGTQSATSGAESRYVQVDVGPTVSMPEVRFFFRGSAGRKTYIKLKASTDGVNWDYILGSASKWETIDDMPPAPGNDYSIVTIQASFSWYGVKPYRYLRLYGNGSSASATNELVAIIGNASGSVTKIGSEGILTNSITADKIKVDSLSAISGDLGTIKVGSANIEDLAVDTIKIKDNAVTSLLEVQRTQQRVEQNFTAIPSNTLVSNKIKAVLMSGLSKNNRYLVYWRGVIAAGMSSRLSNTPPYFGWARKRVYFGSTSSTDIVGSRILAENNQLNGNYIRWYESNSVSTGDVTQWNVAEGIVDETGSLCLWVDVEWKSFMDNVPADTLYGYLYMSELSVLISEFKK